MTNNSTTNLMGQVESTNDKGVKVGGEWRNYSRYAKDGAIADAKRGDNVELEIDVAGFIRSLKVLGAGPAQPSQTPADDGGYSDQAADELEYAGMGSLSQKDVLIIRQSSVRGAIDFAASRPDMKAADVLKLAEVIEHWICR